LFTFFLLDEISKSLSRYRELDSRSIQIVQEVADLLETLGHPNVDADSLRCQIRELLTTLMDIKTEQLSEANDVNKTITEGLQDLRKIDSPMEKLPTIRKPRKILKPRKIDISKISQPIVVKIEEPEEEEIEIKKKETKKKVVVKKTGVKRRRRRRKQQAVADKPATAASTSAPPSEAPSFGDTDDSPDEDKEAPDDVNEPLYCTCNKPSYGNMIMCDNDSCSIEWFHYKCAKIKRAPKGKWFCQKCRYKNKPSLIKKSEK